MPTCPNCSYKVVLLSNRPKYRCALCSRLYSQKHVENKEFREWNKIQKLLDIEEFGRLRKEELKGLRRLRKSIKLLFNPPRDKKGYSNKNRLKLESWIKQNALTNHYKKKIKHRLNFYRQKQKHLAQLHLKNCNEKVSAGELFKSPPTFVLADLLKS